MDELRRKLKEEVVRANRGPFRGWWEALLQFDPGTLRRVHEFLLVVENGGPVSEKMRHLIWVAGDSVVTHLYPRGIGVHGMIALDCGATVREVVETLEIATSVSLRGLEAGLPIVLDVIRQAGLRVPSSPADAAAVKERLTARMGVWPDWMEGAVEVIPDLLERLVELGYAPAQEGGLDPKSRELIFLAANGCPAIVNPDGVRRHARRALELGASPEEVVHTLQITNTIGLHPLAEGLPQMVEPFTRALEKQ